MPIIKHIPKRRRREQNKAADEKRGTARERGYSTAWDRFAKNWLANNPLCRYCEARGEITPAELVDHVEPHNRDPTKFWPGEDDNPDDFFASCCRSCHNGPKQSVERIAEATGKPIRDIMKRRRMWK